MRRLGFRKNEVFLLQIRLNTLGFTVRFSGRRVVRIWQGRAVPDRWPGSLCVIGQQGSATLARWCDPMTVLFPSY